MRLLSSSLALVLIALPAASEEGPRYDCGPRSSLVDFLSLKYNESVTWRGILKGGERLFEIFTAADGITWSLVMTLPNGAGCLLAYGEGWQAPERIIGKEAEGGKRGGRF